jgi:hypothetical protein
VRSALVRGWSTAAAMALLVSGTRPVDSGFPELATIVVLATVAVPIAARSPGRSSHVVMTAHHIGS